MRIGQKIRSLLGQFIPGLKPEHPVPAFFRVISDHFEKDPGRRQDMFVSMMEGMQKKLEEMAEADMIGDLRQRVLDGGSIDLEEQTKIQEIQLRERTILEKLQPDADGKVSPQAYGEARGAFDYLQATWTILGWGEPSVEEFLTPIAEAELNRASDAVLEGGQSDHNSQSALSDVLRSRERLGIKLSEPTLRRAAAARAPYVRPSDTESDSSQAPVYDPKLAWRQAPGASRETALDALKKVSVDQLPEALAAASLEPPLSEAEKTDVVKSVCNRVGWSSSQLRTVINDANPFAAHLGFRILEDLERAQATAEQHGVELSEVDADELAHYKAQMSFLAVQLKDPVAEGCPAISRDQLVESLQHLHLRDLKDAMASQAFDPPLSREEKHSAAANLLGRELGSATQGLESRLEDLNGQIEELKSRLEAGDATHALYAVRDSAFSSHYPDYYARMKAFGEEHGVEADAALIAKGDTLVEQIGQAQEQLAGWVETAREKLREQAE